MLGFDPRPASLRDASDSPGHVSSPPPANSGLRSVTVPRLSSLVLAAGVFAFLYVLLLPGLFLLVVAVFAWETLRWLLASVLLLPILTALGLVGLLKGCLPTGLLIGAIAARTPARIWPKAVAAFLLPLVDLLLLRRAMLPHLAERVLLALMDHRALFLLDTAAPLAASMLAALLVPRRLMRAMLR